MQTLTWAGPVRSWCRSCSFPGPTHQPSRCSTQETSLLMSRQHLQAHSWSCRNCCWQWYFPQDPLSAQGQRHLGQEIRGYLYQVNRKTKHWSCQVDLQLRRSRCHCWLHLGSQRIGPARNHHPWIYLCFWLNYGHGSYSGQRNYSSQIISQELKWKC